MMHISAQNIDCGYLFEPPQQGGSNEYLQSMFLCRKKKNNEYPCKPQFYYIKVGFKGSALYTLRNNAYLNILKISPPKTENFRYKF